MTFQNFTSKEPSNCGKTVTEEQWLQMVSQCHVSKEDLNKLVMNYLVIEGYMEAADNFSKEANLVPEVELESIHQRMQIRKLIEDGNLDGAIDKLNDLNLDILDQDPKLYFALLQQKFIELIRMGTIREALLFAQDELAPLGERNPEILDELEQTMTLLAFDSSHLEEGGQLSGLLDPSHRFLTATQVNSAILRCQSQAQEARLPNLLKLLLWAQDKLSERMTFPKITDFESCKLQF